MNTRWRKLVKLYAKQPDLKIGDVSINQSGTGHLEVISLLKWDDDIQDYHGKDVAIIDRRRTKSSVRFNKRKVHYRKKRVKNHDFYANAFLMN